MIASDPLCEAWHRRSAKIVRHVANGQPEPTVPTQRCQGALALAVWGRTHDSLGSRVGAATRAIFDDELLTKPLRQPLTRQACDDVLRATGRGADDVAHPMRRIGLRPCSSRHGRQRSSARRQTQKISAGNLHGALPDCLRRSLPASRNNRDHLYPVRYTDGFGRAWFWLTTASRCIDPPLDPAAVGAAPSCPQATGYGSRLICP
jgi:hypothetical protein